MLIIDLSITIADLPSRSLRIAWFLFRYMRYKVVSLQVLSQQLHSQFRGEAHLPHKNNQDYEEN